MSKLASTSNIGIRLIQVLLAGFMVLVICLFYTAHCVWVSSEAYSAPSIVLSSRTPSGTHVFDDFREAYSWLRHCTEPDDIVRIHFV